MLLHVGSFAPEKNHAGLLRIVERVERPDAHLVLVGDGPLRSTIEGEAAANQRPGARPAERRATPARWGRPAGAAEPHRRHPRRHPRSGRAVAPDRGLRRGGVGEAVRDGETGRLIPSGDEAAFVEAVRGLLADDARRWAMGPPRALSSNATTRWSAAWIASSVSITRSLPVSHRVFHLIKSLGRGGAEVLLAEGLTVADRDRFAYGYGYFLPWKDAIVPELDAQGAEVVCFEAKDNARILLAARRVAKHLRAWGADVVHAHLPVAGAVARLAGRLAGVPVVYTEHNLMERYHPLTRRLNLATWGQQAQAIAVSGDVEDSIRRHAGDRVPVRTVLNGVNTRSYDPANHDGTAVRAAWGIPADAPLVGTVAVFRTQKRLDHWLDVAQQVRDGCARGALPARRRRPAAGGGRGRDSRARAWSRSSTWPGCRRRRGPTSRRSTPTS